MKGLFSFLHQRFQELDALVQFLPFDQVTVVRTGRGSPGAMHRIPALGQQIVEPLLNRLHIHVGPRPMLGGIQSQII